MTFKLSDHKFLAFILSFILVLCGIVLGVYLYSIETSYTQNDEFIKQTVDKKQSFSLIMCNPNFIKSYENRCECANGYRGARCEVKYVLL